jgi:starch phosphorylase
MDNLHMMDILENKIIPTYYKQHTQWLEIMKSAMTEIEIEFDSSRQADEYYEKMFNY